MSPKTAVDATMHGSEDKCASGRAPMLYILAVHACLVPIAIAITRLTLGFDNALTPLNQKTWTPIIFAQGTLLAVFLGLGADRLWRRLLLFCGGSLYVVGSLVWAYSMLCTFPAPKLWAYYGYLRMMSLPIILPPLVTGAALTTLRPLVGVIGRDQIGAYSRQQFRIADLLLVTTAAAAATAWFSSVAALRGVAASINVKSLFTNTPYRVIEAAGAAIFAFGSSRRRWMGLLLMVAGAGARLWWFGSQTVAYEVVLGTGYSWSIELTTVLVMRRVGFRLRGRSTAQQATIGETPTRRRDDAG